MIQIGDTFNRLTVTQNLPKGKHGQRRVMVRCSCGKVKPVNEGALSSGATQSCGCLATEKRQKRMTTHGATKTSEYRVWADMKNRCYNPNLANYNNYGGRGISVCEEWRDSFDSFMSDMGPRPSALHTLDRIDNDDNYTRENCRWADKITQSRNQRQDRS